MDAVMLAGRWTLLDRSGERLVEECLGRGIALVAAAPFNSGILARPWPPDDARYDYGDAPAEVLERARELAHACEAAGTVAAGRRTPVPAAPRRGRHRSRRHAIAGSRHERSCRYDRAARRGAVAIVGLIRSRSGAESPGTPSVAHRGCSSPEPSTVDGDQSAVNVVGRRGGEKHRGTAEVFGHPHRPAGIRPRIAASRAASSRKACVLSVAM